ncbi:translation initiation factor IF-2, putative [Babesia caballi]|uniref:Translation initiation factor IF-2, putative n=1 Tax=Babesia caballi TaxID=5871 RepID=A0AAV4M001_BABCB|nr:translation initiation factor IF-2, putative [Babesia caballi]
MLRVNYAACLRACGVSVARGSYAWSDVHGRRFRCENKRHVLVSFESAALASRTFGFQAIRVSPEPPTPQVGTTGSHINAKSVLQRCVNSCAVPVVAIVGHKDHGKTTLMERLTGDVLAAHEPGRTTQQVVIRPAVLATESGHMQATLLDTPGDALFEVVRGRALHLADVAVVVMSAEGGESQTRDAILQADRFRVPVVFCINKADLEFSDAEVARAELRAQCSRMYQDGLISTDMTPNVATAIAVSARTGDRIAALGTEISRRLAGATLPVNPTFSKDCFGGAALKEVEPFIRRTNCLVSSGAPPLAVCFVLELERTHSFGPVLTVVVRHGVLIEGAYFVAGTEYGRVSGIYPAHGRIAPDSRLERVTVGHAVRVTGLKTADGTSADDLLLVLPQHEAFRLSQYRRDVQLLRAQQVDGPPLEVPWAVVLKSKDDAGYDQAALATHIDERSDAAGDHDPLRADSTPGTSDYNPAFPSSIYIRPVDDNGNDATTTDDCDTTDYDDDSVDETHQPGSVPADDPHAAWAAKVAEQNEELRRRWESKLQVSDSLGKAPKPHGGIVAPKVTPEMGRPVVPVILRANFVGTFDALLDGFEALERKHNVRIPVVHGGLGAVAPGDIVQADIGNKFGHCPVYAFQVPVLSDAAKHAVINHVTVKQFNVYSDLLAEVERRCERAVRRAAEARERDLLRR